jgi:hypothetical protein
VIPPALVLDLEHAIARRQLARGRYDLIAAELRRWSDRVEAARTEELRAMRAIEVFVLGDGDGTKEGKQ